MILFLNFCHICDKAVITYLIKILVPRSTKVMSMVNSGGTALATQSVQHPIHHCRKSTLSHEVRKSLVKGSFLEVEKEKNDS